MEWRRVTLKWSNGATTTTRVRQKEVLAYLGNLPFDQIISLDVAEKDGA